MKILIADNISEKAAKILQAENSWQVVNLPKEKNRSLIEEIRDAEALVVRSATKVTAELLERAPKLRAVGRAGVGVDNVDMDAATRHGIVVMNTPGGNAASVAEQTLGFMVCLARHIPQADASVKVGKWEKKKLTGSELRGKTLGLIGFGRVGSEVARLARAFEMQVIAYDPYVGSRLATEQGMKLVSLTDVLAESDYLSLHCSLTPETNHLLNAERLALTRRGIRIINCARGELIDEKALLAAIESGQVAGAALDVFEVEPPKDSALVRHPSVIATPHIAGSTEEAQEIVGIAIAEQVRDFLKYGTPRNAVNLPAITAEEFQKLQPYLELGEKLGSFLAQVAGERIEEVRISYDGGLAKVNTHLVRNAVLKGILNQVVSEEANLVNAGTLAQERGIEVVELRSARRATFSNSLGIAVKLESGTASVLGMVGPRGTLRILGITDVDIEAPLKGTMLFIRNQDVPGVIGRVGTLLGEHQVNIANFALGRDRQAGEAIGLVNVDTPVPSSALDQLRAVPAIRTAKLITLAS